MADENSSELNEFLLENQSGPMESTAVVEEETTETATATTEETTTEKPATETSTEETTETTTEETTTEKPAAETTTEEASTETTEATTETTTETSEVASDNDLKARTDALMEKEGITEAEALEKISAELDAIAPESVAIGELYTQLHNDLGWELPTGENKLEETTAGLRTLLEKIVKDNSIPTYASEASKAFDTFVRNGGDPQLYLDTTYGSPDYTKLSAETEEGQRVVMRHLLKEENPEWSPDKIQDRINILAEKELLESDAAEAIPKLEAIHTAREKTLAASAENTTILNAEKIETNNLAIRTAINSEANIAGFETTDAEKDRFYEHMTVRDKNGMTAYDRGLAEKGTKLKLAFLHFRGVDAESLMESVADKATKGMKASIQRRQAEITAAAGSNSSVNASPDIEDENKNTDLNDFVLNQSA